VPDRSINQMKNYRIVIVSGPDMENLVSGIWIDDQMIAEINQESNLQIFFLKPITEYGFYFSDIILILEEARSKLLN
jgi:hypothetical protein